MENYFNDRGVLSRLFLEFVRESIAGAKEIIQERNLREHERRIKPLKGSVGIAGGEKFFHKGIFFKYSIDLHGLYDGDEFAMKSAGAELRAINSVLRKYEQNMCRVEDRIRTPLFCLVDYRGYRILASSVLPISHSTLVYGSDNAGRTIVKTNNRFNQLTQSLANDLKLKEHEIALRNYSNQTKIASGNFDKLETETLMFGVDCEGMFN